MTNGPVFVLDASVLIEAARRYYAFDLAPRFWGSLVSAAANGKIQSIDRIKEELERGKDELARWAENDFRDAFFSTDCPDVIRSFSEIMNWVQANSQYSQAAKTQFAGIADGWLIAYAKARGGIVVTHEVLAPAVKGRIPIPNVCRAFGVTYVDTFEMLRRLGVRFA